MTPSFASLMSHWAVAASWAAGVPALVLLALGEWRSFPVRWRWFLALVVAVRLAAPVVPGIAWHPSAYLHGPRSVASTVVNTGAESVVPTGENGWWALVWLLGGLTVIAWLLLSQYLLWRRITREGVAAPQHLQEVALSCLRQAGVKRKVELLMVPNLATPAVFGFWRPFLLLPQELEEHHSSREIRCILLHEAQHIRSHDTLWTWTGLILCALHWFNPLVWLCFRRFRADRELMCDARTLGLLTPGQRLAYGKALIKTWENVAGRQPTLLTPFLRRNSATYHRIHMSLQSNKSNNGLLHFIAILMIPALSLFSLTTVKADGDVPRKPAEAEKGSKSDSEAPKPGKKKKSKRVRGDGEADAPRRGARDGDADAKPGQRDGDAAAKPSQRDGDAAAKPGQRDGDAAAKPGQRDGEGSSKRGPRDGEGERKTGPRDGDKVAKSGSRDGDAK